ncbi:MAG TPA: hypothetical protein VGU43_03525, partial [Thermoplasmata archaeon]|nr:hypothetical protein [Thermoplasmata archaeon]
MGAVHLGRGLVELSGRQLGLRLRERAARPGHLRLGESAQADEPADELHAVAQPLEILRRLLLRALGRRVRHEPARGLP